MVAVQLLLLLKAKMYVNMSSKFLDNFLCVKIQMK